MLNKPLLNRLRDRERENNDIIEELRSNEKWTVDDLIPLQTNSREILSIVEKLRASEKCLKPKAEFESISEALFTMETIGFFLTCIDEVQVEIHGSSLITTHVDRAGILIQQLCEGIQCTLDDIVEAKIMNEKVIS